MIKRRCKAGDYELIAHGSMTTYYEVRTTYPLVECIHNEFLLPIRGAFRAGDRINLVRYSNDTWKEVLEVCEGLRVVHSDNQGVELLKLFDIVSLDRPGEDGIVVARGFAGQFPVRVDGAVHRAFNTIVEANEYAAQLGQETGRPVTLYDAKAKKAA